MCPYGSTSNFNFNYVRDLRRGRVHSYERWERVYKYAHARWMKAHSMQAANWWRCVLITIEGRRP